MRTWTIKYTLNGTEGTDTHTGNLLQWILLNRRKLIMEITVVNNKEVGQSKNVIFVTVKVF